MMTEVKREKRTTKKAAKTEERTTKRERVPYAANTSRLAVPASVRENYPGIPQHCFRWVNDEEGEVHRRLDAGWEVCKGAGVNGSFLNQAEQTGEVIARPVGPGKTTSDLKAVLMCCHPDIFEEDRKLQEQANMAFQNSLKKGKEEAGQRDADGGYTPYTDDGAVGFSRTQSNRIE